MSANSCSYLAKWQPYDHNFNTITSRKTTTKTVHILQVFSLYFDCTTLRNEREVLIFFFISKTPLWHSENELIIWVWTIIFSLKSTSDHSDWIYKTNILPDEISFQCVGLKTNFTPDAWSRQYKRNIMYPFTRINTEGTHTIWTPRISYN